MTPSQVQALTWWVSIGAPAGGAIGQFGADAANARALAQVLHLASGDDASVDAEELPTVAAADPAAIAALADSGFNVRPVATGSHLLDVVHYRRTPATLADLANLRKLAPQVRTLALRSSGITDDRVDDLLPMPHMVLLKLDDNPLTDAGVARLAGLQALRSLSVTGTRVSDAGVLALARSQSLERVYAWGTAVGRDAAAKSRAVNPRLQLISVVEPAGS